MATISFENVRDVNPYYKYDPRVMLGFNAVPNYSYEHKSNTLKTILEGSGIISAFIDDPKWGPSAPHEVRIRLHTVRETAISKMRVNDFCFGTISQIAYANRTHQPGQKPYETVHIEMDSWYFENYPLGYCAGMLSHEFAVHILSDRTLASGALRDEENYTTGAQRGQEYGFSSMPRVTPSAAGQADHVFAAYPECDRYEQYQETVLDVARSMLGRVGPAANGTQVPVTDADVTDLFKCYLMDVASIQATNDHRAKGILSPKALADCFNEHRRRLLNKINDPRHALSLHVPDQTHMGAVMKDFVYLLSSLAWSLGPNWSKSWSGY